MKIVLHKQKGIENDIYLSLQLKKIASTQKGKGPIRRFLQSE